eukprot:TRINITY_DN66234_c3_g1_i1.p1 TRINITY_DN66234_c3_g1~~TRINITY_DN66234_c3_g1_i1.p1  ORF type:complete len:750 (+),score=337.03 TRINITY_DN66234_c3_g1_i1:42-2252(+)
MSCDNNGVVDPMLAKWLGIKPTVTKTASQQPPQPQSSHCSISAPRPTATTTTPTAPPSSEPTRQESVNVSMLLNQLVDGRVSTRKRAFEKLGRLFGVRLDDFDDMESSDSDDDDNDNNNNDDHESKQSHVQYSDEMRGVMLELMKPLLKRLADPVERCREMAAALVLHAVERVFASADNDEQVAKFLPLIVPVVAFRMSSESMMEQSEAIRLKLVAILRALTDRFVKCDAVVLTLRAKAATEPKAMLDQPIAKERLGLFLRDMCAVLRQGAQDSMPDVRVASCSCLQQLALALPQSIRPYSVELSMCVRDACLMHKHARVRVAGVETLRLLIPCGAADVIRELAAFREANVIDLREFFGQGERRRNFMGLLVADPNTRVRQAFFNMLVEWTTSMREWYDFETLLMPYLLSGIGDDSLAVRRAAYGAIDRMGIDAEHQRADDQRLKDRITFASAVAERTRSHILRMPLLMFPPLTKRPRLGAREVVGKFLRRLMPAVLAEVTDWKDDTRLHSLLLLRTLLLFAEESVTQHCKTLVDAFVNCIAQWPARLLHVEHERFDAFDLDMHNSARLADESDEVSDDDGKEKNRLQMLPQESENEFTVLLFCVRLVARYADVWPLLDALWPHLRDDVGSGVVARQLAAWRVLREVAEYASPSALAQASAATSAKAGDADAGEQQKKVRWIPEQDETATGLSMASSPLHHIETLLAEEQRMLSDPMLSSSLDWVRSSVRALSHCQ